jgi:hypothetical protein
MVRSCNEYDSLPAMKLRQHVATHVVVQHGSGRPPGYPDIRSWGIVPCDDIANHLKGGQLAGLLVAWDDESLHKRFEGCIELCRHFSTEDGKAPSPIATFQTQQFFESAVINSMPPINTMYDNQHEFAKGGFTWLSIQPMWSSSRACSPLQCATHCPGCSTESGNFRCSWSRLSVSLVGGPEARDCKSHTVIPR